MTKQEEIRERLLKIINKTARHSKNSGRRNTGIHTLIESAVEEILSYLHSQGVVIKVDRELPDIFDEESTAQFPVWKDGYIVQRDMLKAGYSAWEPLVKDV